VSYCVNACFNQWGLGTNVNRSGYFSWRFCTPWGADLSVPCSIEHSIYEADFGSSGGYATRNNEYYNYTIGANPRGTSRIFITWRFRNTTGQPLRIRVISFANVGTGTSVTGTVFQDRDLIVNAWSQS